jgi:predicted secreted protein
MATTNPTYGTSLPLKLGATSTTAQIVNLKSNSISLSTDTRETTTKDSGSYKEYLATRNDGQISFEGLYTTTAGATGIEDIIGWKEAGTMIYWEIGTGTTGHPKWTGQGIVTSLDFDMPDGDNATFSGSIQTSGTITIGVYP